MFYQFKKWHRILLLIVLLITIIGILDSGYLSFAESTHTQVNCSITGGCSDVLNSTYAKMFGIPLAYLGVLFYVGMFILSIYVLVNKHKLYLKLLTLGGLTGFLMSLYFIYIQLFEIYYICQYCMLSAISSTLIFILTTTVYFTTVHLINHELT